LIRGCVPGNLEKPPSPQRLSTAEGLVKLGPSVFTALKNKGTGFQLSLE